MFTYPGAKLLFMGCELGEPGEWRHQGQLSWDLLEQAPHRGLRQLVADLNQLYRESPACIATASKRSGLNGSTAMTRPSRC